MNPQLKSVGDIYAFNSLALPPALSDLSDEEAGRRCRNGEGNSITFLVGHLLASRVGLLKRLGEATENPFADLFGGSTAAQDASASWEAAVACGPMPESAIFRRRKARQRCQAETCTGRRRRAPSRRTGGPSRGRSSPLDRAAVRTLATLAGLRSVSLRDAPRACANSSASQPSDPHVALCRRSAPRLRQ